MSTENTENGGTLFVSNALIFLSDQPIKAGLTEKSGLVNSEIHGAGYIPPLFRRPKLKRFAGISEALGAARAVYRWKRSHPASAPVLVSVPLAVGTDDRA